MLFCNFTLYKSYIVVVVVVVVIVVVVIIVVVVVVCSVPQTVDVVYIHVMFIAQPKTDAVLLTDHQVKSHVRMIYLAGASGLLARGAR